MPKASHFQLLTLLAMDAAERIILTIHIVWPRFSSICGLEMLAVTARNTFAQEKGKVGLLRSKSHG